MLLYKSDFYIILFNVLWQLSLITFDIICLNRKRMIIVLIPINAIKAATSWKLLDSINDPLNVREILLNYFLVVSICFLVFGYRMSKILPGENAIIKGFDIHRIKKYSNFLLIISYICLVILIFNIAKYQKYFSKYKYSYSAINLLLLVDIIVNFLLAKRIRKYGIE